MAEGDYYAGAHTNDAYYFRNPITRRLHSFPVKRDLVGFVSNTLELHRRRRPSRVRRTELDLEFNVFTEFEERKRGHKIVIAPETLVRRSARPQYRLHDVRALETLRQGKIQKP